MDTELVVIISLAVTLPLLAVCAVGWFRASRRVKRLEGQLFDGPTMDESAQRLTQAVEALAMQMDELAAGQEFLQRVVTTRTDINPRVLPEPRGVITPH